MYRSVPDLHIFNPYLDSLIDYTRPFPWVLPISGVAKYLAAAIETERKRRRYPPQGYGREVTYNIVGVGPQGNMMGFRIEEALTTMGERGKIKARRIGTIKKRGGRFYYPEFPPSERLGTNPVIVIVDDSFCPHSNFGTGGQDTFVISGLKMAADWVSSNLPPYLNLPVITASIIGGEDNLTSGNQRRFIQEGGETFHVSIAPPKIMILMMDWILCQIYQQYREETIRPPLVMLGIVNAGSYWALNLCRDRFLRTPDTSRREWLGKTTVIAVDKIPPDVLVFRDARYVDPSVDDNSLLNQLCREKVQSGEGRPNKSAFPQGALTILFDDMRMTGKSLEDLMNLIRGNLGIVPIPVVLCDFYPTNQVLAPIKIRNED